MTAGRNSDFHMMIGSDGASIDELVTHRINGRLVPIGDAPALAGAMLDLWHRPPEISAGTRLPTSVEAADALVALAGPHTERIAA